jgi:hypothetical protein
VQTQRWQAIVDAERRAPFAEYLERCPEGKYAGQAKRQIAAIEARQALDEAAAALEAGDYESAQKRLDTVDEAELAEQALQRRQALVQKLEARRVAASALDDAVAALEAGDVERAQRRLKAVDDADLSEQGRQRLQSLQQRVAEQRASTVLDEAVAALDAGDDERAQQRLDELGSDEHWPARLQKRREELGQRLDREQAIARRLEQAEQALAADRLTQPTDDNAVAHYRWVLERDPDNRAAEAGLRKVVERYRALIEQALERGRRDRARSLLERARSVGPKPFGFEALAQRATKPEPGTQLATFTGHDDAVLSVAFGPNGKWALSGSKDQTVKLWDVGTGELVRTFTGHDSGVSSVAFGPDGERALSGSWDDTVKLWQVR